jgi:peptide/nickel transport system substrate-binding protein
LGHSLTRFGRRAFLAAISAAASANALGRTPYGGVLKLRLPLYFAGLDPHSLDDPLSALFASAIADPLFALDAAGNPYPALASTLPEHAAGGARVRLRPELVSARGKPLSARDVVFSFERAQTLGGAAVLGAFRRPRVEHGDPLSVIVSGADPLELARALASPLTAIVPRGFAPLNPDGSGAFKATTGSNALTLTRNENAARAAAFLERIEISRAPDLADALRAFEAGATDVGWLGNGLYRPRTTAIPLEGPIFGWIVLRTGKDANTWGAPGVAQQLAATLPADALSHFGVRALADPGEGVHWRAGPASLLVTDDAPYALELGRALEPLLGSPGNEIRATPLPRAAWLEARRSRRFQLMLDFVRSASLDATQATEALLAAVDPALAGRPPRSSASLSDLTRSLTLGIVGEVHISGAQMPAFERLDAWQLGGVWFNDAKR